MVVGAGRSGLAAGAGEVDVEGDVAAGASSQKALAGDDGGDVAASATCADVVGAAGPGDPGPLGDLAIGAALGEAVGGGEGHGDGTRGAAAAEAFSGDDGGDVAASATRADVVGLTVDRAIGVDNAD